MTGALTDILPPELQTVSVLLAGIVALLGLVLWSAGIKVARMMAAMLMGGIVACVGIWILPSAAGLAVATSGILGLAVGVMAGAVAFRFVQGAALALCLGAVVGAGYYQWQISHSPPPIHSTVAAQDLKIDLKRFLPATPADAQAMMQGQGIKPALTRGIAQVQAWWMAVPIMLRQGVLILGGGVAIVAMAIAWAIPRHTTWVFTAAVGTLLLLVGAQTVVHAYGPQFEGWVPGSVGGTWSRAGAVAIVFLMGLLMQRLLFWPGRRQRKEREKDHVGQVAAA